MSGTPCTAVAELPAECPDAGLQRLKLVTAAGLVLLFWAGAYVAISVAVRELSPAPFALARVGGAALVLLLFLPLVRGASLSLPPRRDLPALALMATLAFPIYHVAINTGQQTVSAGVTSVLIATLPIFATIIARFTLGERPTLRAWLGILIAFGGVTLLATGRDGDFHLDSGALLILLSAMSGAGFMVLQRQLTKRYTGLQLTVWGMWIGTLMLTPFAPGLFMEIRSASNATLLAVAYIAVLPTALAYLLWTYVLKELPAARATSLLYIVPPITFTLAWLLIGDVPGPMDIVSSAIVLGGVTLAQRASRKQA